MEQDKDGFRMAPAPIVFTQPRAGRQLGHCGVGLYLRHSVCFTTGSSEQLTQIQPFEYCGWLIASLGIARDRLV